MIVLVVHCADCILSMRRPCWLGHCLFCCAVSCTHVAQICIGCLFPDCLTHVVLFLYDACLADMMYGLFWCCTVFFLERWNSAESKMTIELYFWKGARSPRGSLKFYFWCTAHLSVNLSVVRPRTTRKGGECRSNYKIYVVKVPVRLIFPRNGPPACLGPSLTFLWQGKWMLSTHLRAHVRIMKQ